MPKRFDAASYLESRVKFGIKLGLRTMRALCTTLGQPQLAYPTLLIAGTNGKGSVAAYLDAGLRSAGLWVGRYTSPHLQRVNERIAVGGRAIGAAPLARALGEVRAAAALLGVEPTYFEALTAAAFLHFRSARVDLAVLEVGMGGRLDATAVALPLVSAIVSIARDHEADLGSTLAAIAREKAGVLRAGRTTVLGPLPLAARRCIAGIARRLGTPLIEAGAGVNLHQQGDLLDITTPCQKYRGLRPLPGAHQRDNLLVALRVLEAAAEAGVPVDLQAVPGGIARTRWPGRLQWISRRPPLLLDGAHNPAGARALAAYLRPRRPFVLVFGVMADKRVEALCRSLFPLAAAVVLTRPAQGRAAAPAEIARRAGAAGARALQEPSPRRALALARSRAGPHGLVVVAGSLYLVGEVLDVIGRKARRAHGRVDRGHRGRRLR